jgi:hypothetical protein
MWMPSPRISIEPECHDRRAVPHGCTHSTTRCPVTVMRELSVGDVGEWIRSHLPMVAVERNSGALCGEWALERPLAPHRAG